MRYSINFDKLINRLIPHYLSGRRLILFLQATLKPLQALNDLWAVWAREARIDASMTSQIGPFEWFLNRRLGRYIDGRITLRKAIRPGVPIYLQSENVPACDTMRLFKEGETGDTARLYDDGEESEEFSFSFLVSTPEPDEALISRAEYDAILRSYVEKYRIANKTYIIKYHQ